MSESEHLAEALTGLLLEEENGWFLPVYGAQIPSSDLGAIPRTHKESEQEPHLLIEQGLPSCYSRFAKTRGCNNAPAFYTPSPRT